MRKASLVGLAAVLLPWIAACATSPERQARIDNARAERAVAVLATRADADSLAAAGLMSSFKNRERSLQLLTQASMAAPDRPDLVWLRIQYCQSISGCDTAPLESGLRALDGKNGVGWMASLADARKRGDEVAQSAALAAIGHSDRMDTYWTTLVAHLSGPVASTGKLSLYDAEIAVIGVLAAMYQPGDQAAITACKPPRLTQIDLLETCRGVARSYLNGDSTITEMIGMSMAKQVWPEDSPEWNAAAERRRVWDYRSHFSEPVFAWVKAHPDDYLALHQQYHREQDVFRAAVIVIGGNPDPPPPG